MPSILERVPIVGKVIKNQRELIEAKTAYEIELEEDVADWTAIAAQADEKDVSWTNYKKNHEDCWEAYIENPLAKGYVDRLIDFVIKDGFQLTSKDNKTVEALERFEEETDWKALQTQACREITIYGELFDRFFASGDSFPETRFVDPSSIKNIVTDEEDAQTVKGYFHEYEVLHYDAKGDVTTTKDQKTELIEADEIIHAKVNTVSTAKRGISDLLCVLKWLKRHKITFTNLIRRTNVQTSVIGQKIISGAGASSTTTGGWKKASDDATSPVTGKRKERTIKPGTWYVTTPNVEYKFTSLPTEMKGMIDLIKMINKTICAGLGLSEAWLGDTAESNLATTKAIELPILAKFERRQEELKAFFEEHVKKSLALSGMENAEFEVVAPELTAKDAVEFAQAMRELAEGLEKMAQNMWISDETAAQTVGDYLDYFDSFKDEQDKVKNQERVKKEEHEEPPPPPPVGMPEPEDIAASFKKGVKEAEVKFSKAAMDDLILNYTKVLVDAFKEGKEKVLAEMRKKGE